MRMCARALKPLGIHGEYLTSWKFPDLFGHLLHEERAVLMQQQVPISTICLISRAVGDMAKYGLCGRGQRLLGAWRDRLWRSLGRPVLKCLSWETNPFIMDASIINRLACAFLNREIFGNLLEAKVLTEQHHIEYKTKVVRTVRPDIKSRMRRRHAGRLRYGLRPPLRLPAQH